jgi:hypothetical protein
MVGQSDNLGPNRREEFRADGVSPGSEDRGGRGGRSCRSCREGWGGMWVGGVVT